MFLFCTCPETRWGPYSLPFNSQRRLFREGQSAGLCSLPITQSSLEFKNKWGYAPHPQLPTHGASAGNTLLVSQNMHGRTDGRTGAGRQPKLDIHGSVHRKYIPIYIQQDASLHSLRTQSGNCSTCFGWCLHPSSPILMVGGGNTRNM
jgi:hypothetical protein